MKGLVGLAGCVLLLSGMIISVGEADQTRTLDQPQNMESSAQAPPRDGLIPGQPLPAELLIPAEGDRLTRVGEPMVYQGEESLFEYIDGGAPQYIEYGYQEVASQELMLGEHTYIFDVYRMNDPLAAFGIYSTRAPLSEPPIGSFIYSSFTPYQGLVALDAYLFDISAYESGEWTRSEMALLVGQAAAALAATKTAAPPEKTVLDQAPLAYLPAVGRMPGSERLARGPVSLRAAVGSAATGVFADVLQMLQTSIEDQAHDQGLPASWWAVAGYHPRLSEDDQLSAETTLVMLLSEGDLTTFGQATQRSLANLVSIEALGSGQCWTEKEGATGYIACTPGRILLVTSTLAREAFVPWASQLLDP